MIAYLFACEQFALIAHPQPAPPSEAWQLAAGLEAVAILVLLIGWLSHYRDHTGNDQ